jgi:hypothetical protein
LQVGEDRSCGTKCHCGAPWFIKEKVIPSAGQSVGRRVKLLDDGLPSTPDIALAY